MILSMKRRLDCPRSYATEDTPDLLCSMSGKCDGKLYDCCLWDMPAGVQMEIYEKLEKEPTNGQHNG